MATDKEAIKNHLSRPSKKNEIKTFSAFWAALGDARDATGRDTYGYALEEEKKKWGNWLGNMGYMALLDQIGSCFKPKGDPHSGNDYKKALHYFGKNYANLTEDQINALYALRCAFVHDFSLSNIGKDRRGGLIQSLTHHFSLTTEDLIGIEDIVKLPLELWDGVYSNIKKENATIVNLKLFGDLVEEVSSTLFDLADEDKLEIALHGGANELIGRYFFYSSLK